MGALGGKLVSDAPAQVVVVPTQPAEEPVEE